MSHKRNDANDKNRICKRIGILGGTFDPIHNGHLMIAKEAQNEYDLSEVILIPTGVSYMKKDVTDSVFRYEMVKLAIQDKPEFQISDVEIQREGNTYTCDTIAYFREKYPTDDLFFIIGTDSLFSIEKWRNVQYIFNNCTILCATRPGEPADETIKQEEQTKAKELSIKFNAKINFIHCVPMDISSTEIRAYRKTNPDAPLNNLELPVSVAEYIFRQDLYDSKTEAIHRLLKDNLKPKRLRHTIGVVDVAVLLAQKWGCDLEKARIAALLHDCAKYLDYEAKCSLCAKYGVAVKDIEKANPELLHAKAGALLAYDKYNIKDNDILSAIFYHTTGKPNMSLIEQIIYVADYIEPNRKHSQSLPEYRKMAMIDLNKVTAYILKDTTEYLNSSDQRANQLIDPMTQETYEYYKKYL